MANTKIAGTLIEISKIENLSTVLYKDLIERQVHGAYPDAEIKEVQEINLFEAEGKVAYKSFQLGKANYYPLKTFKDLPTDILASVTSTLSKI